MRKVICMMICSIIAIGTLGLSACNNENYPVESGATEILFYARDFEDWSNEYLYDKVKEFNSILDDGIQINMVGPYEDSDYSNAIKSAREGNRAPDIFQISYGNLADEISKGYPTPLNDLFSQAELDDILPHVSDMVCYDGVYYAYPQLTEPSSLLFYRKDMLAAANVTSDPASWSWTDLVDASAKIKPSLRLGQYVIGLPTGLSLAWATVGLQYNTAGHLPINDNWDTCLISSEVTSTADFNGSNEYANLARLWWDLYGNGFVPAGNVSPTGYNDIIEGLCMDKLAMTFAGSWSVAEILNTYPDVADKIGVAPIPTKSGSKAEATATNGGWTYAISNSSSVEKKQKAAAFLKWLLCDTERCAEYFEIAHYSKAAVTASVQTYNAQHAGAENESWRTVINDVAQKAISEPLYTFDISLKYADVLGYISINADASKSEAVINNTISSQLSTTVSNINTLISINSLAGKNPKKQ